ncbi:hypothetical protein ACO0LB_18540 [Undibacterium sp. SXout7W]|uniref:hypothetical protein n=1 Tax=Undibacterium sp. SXout7W TaxID=3413049 RepID=UPI003BF1D2C3
MSCKHLNFSASVRVARVEDVGRYIAEVRVKCIECDMPFQFQGMSPGMSSVKPTVSLDGLEANLPIYPEGQQPNPLQKLMGYSIKNTN